jgi:hypothetical protein
VCSLGSCIRLIGNLVDFSALLAHFCGMSKEYAVRLYNEQGEVIREKLYAQNKKEAKQWLRDMQDETPDAFAFGIDDM